MSKKWFSAWIFLLIAYTFSHLYNLLALPVFADESIYIRWSQLMVDDWWRYFLFPLQDGKTPLFMWLLAPLQLLPVGQLWVSRVFVVGLGAAQMGVSGWTVWQITKSQRAAWLTGVLVACMPFWFFHHRMALIDGLLVLLLSVMVSVVLSLSAEKKVSNRSILLSTALVILTWLSLMTKTPAILAFPGLVLLSVYFDPKHWMKIILVGGSLALGVVLFLLMRAVPGFGQLFSRGSDFLWPLGELLRGAWRQTLPNILSYLSYFVVYMGPATVLLLLSGLFGRHKHSATTHRLFWAGWLFIVPIWLMGKVVFARYFLPVMVFWTPALALSLERILEQLSATKNLQKRVGMSLLLALLVGSIAIQWATFMFLAWWSPNQLPLTESDKQQYLMEWSSGHGIAPLTEWLETESKTRTIAVATEGRFGTLPDGLLLNFYRRNVGNLYIEGIGYPVQALPISFIERAEIFSQVLLVVNSHRQEMGLQKQQLLFEYCRPYGAPCLQVYDITSVLRTLPTKEKI
jgi:hypothetical protein